MLEVLFESTAPGMGPGFPNWRPSFRATVRRPTAAKRRWHSRSPSWILPLRHDKICNILKINDLFDTVDLVSHSMSPDRIGVLRAQARVVGSLRSRYRWYALLPKWAAGRPFRSPPPTHSLRRRPKPPFRAGEEQILARHSLARTPMAGGCFLAPRTVSAIHHRPPLVFAT